MFFSQTLATVKTTEVLNPQFPPPDPLSLPFYEIIAQGLLLGPGFFGDDKFSLHKSPSAIPPEGSDPPHFAAGFRRPITQAAFGPIPSLNIQV